MSTRISTPEAAAGALTSSNLLSLVHWHWKPQLFVHLASLTFTLRACICSSALFQLLLPWDSPLTRLPWVIPEHEEAADFRARLPGFSRRSVLTSFDSFSNPLNPLCLSFLLSSEVHDSICHIQSHPSSTTRQGHMCSVVSSLQVESAWNSAWHALCPKVYSGGPRQLH